MSNAALILGEPELLLSFEKEPNAIDLDLVNQQAQLEDSSDVNNIISKPQESGIKDVPPEGNNTAHEIKPDDSMYECHICLDTAKDAVVTYCGHLYCWPCLHQWLETRPNRQLCPVCKSAIGKEKVIPLYGRNSAQQEDPRNVVPPRPVGQRTEPEPERAFRGLGFGEVFQISFSIGAFPFGFFASSFNIADPTAIANREPVQYELQLTLSQLFMYLGFLWLAWVLFVA